MLPKCLMPLLSVPVNCHLLFFQQLQTTEGSFPPKTAAVMAPVHRDAVRETQLHSKEFAIFGKKGQPGRGFSSRNGCCNAASAPQHWMQAITKFQGSCITYQDQDHTILMWGDFKQMPWHESHRNSLLPCVFPWFCSHPVGANLQDQEWMPNPDHDRPFFHLTFPPWHHSPSAMFHSPNDGSYLQRCWATSPLKDHIII